MRRGCKEAKRADITQALKHSGARSTSVSPVPRSGNRLPFAAASNHERSQGSQLKNDPPEANFEIRGATCADEEVLLQLAAHLNTVNLPNHAPSIRALLEHAEGSFSGAIEAEHCKYVFLLWDRTAQRPVGTSSLIARLGRRDAPYIYFDVIDEERYSRSLDKHFHHTLLRLGFSYAGPTELGGLVVDPSYRGSREKLGRFVSYCRFPFISARRDRFQDQLLAELLPPLEPDGRSHLWEALGRRMTGMSYAEADLLSSRDKEFVRDLFPLGLINTSLLSPEAHGVVGKVGQATRGVERMLKAIGFQYARRVDPFDGGPHFVAPTDQVSLVQQARRAPLAAEPLRGPGARALVMQLLEEAPFLRCVQASCALLESPDPAGSCELKLPPYLISRWQLAVGQQLTITPLPP